jgi:hypothetical protein
MIIRLSEYFVLKIKKKFHSTHFGSEKKAFSVMPINAAAQTKTKMVIPQNL